MKPLEGVDLSESIENGRNVHFIVFNTKAGYGGFNSENSKYDLAETIYHEIKARIDVFTDTNAQGIQYTKANCGAEYQHEYYGGTEFGDLKGKKNQI